MSFLDYVLAPRPVLETLHLYAGLGVLNSLVRVNRWLADRVSHYLTQKYSIEYSIDYYGRLTRKYTFKFWNEDFYEYITQNYTIQPSNEKFSSRTVAIIQCTEQDHPLVDFIIYSGAEEGGTFYHYPKMLCSSIVAIVYLPDGNHQLISKIEDYPVITNLLPAWSRELEEDLCDITNFQRQRKRLAAKMRICDCALEWSCSLNWQHQNCICHCHLYHKDQGLYWATYEELDESLYNHRFFCDCAECHNRYGWYGCSNDDGGPDEYDLDIDEDLYYRRVNKTTKKQRKKGQEKIKEYKKPR